MKTWGCSPKHRDDAVNAFCEATLENDRGEDVLQLGRMDLPALRHYLSRDVPPTAVLGVLSTSLYVTVQRLILPVLYWFDTKQQFSILRPARGEKND
jgi:hypothetical protein